MNPSNAGSGKSPPATVNHNASIQSSTPISNFDLPRRSGPSVPSNPSSNPMPRKGQAARKQHRSQRRPGLENRTNSAPDDYDAMAELRAVSNPNSRRGQTSITHLLDFATPRPFQDHNAYARSYRRNPTWGPGSGYHASDKSRYVHANYRFVVHPEASYSKHASNADLYLDWQHIMQVIASSQSQVASCPICLSEPVAPRMAKCGHIFCLPCLIRFMNSTSSDEEAKPGRGPRWKKCPICEDLVYLQDVRPVRFYAGQESPLPRVGDDVILRLMARNANSTLALPLEGGAEVLNSGEDIPWHYAVNVLDYSHVMKGTRAYMDEQFDEEVAALIQQEQEDQHLFGQDGEWMRKAAKAVQAAKERLHEQGIPDTAPSVPNISTTKSTSEADFYFYSAPPHLYLSPLDIRILKTKYGSFSSFPSTLLPRVEHISTGHVVDDTLRKRAKYLGHLPRGCIISFLECDWTEIVTSETLDSFSADIERRRKRNRDKAIQEERERQRAEHLDAAEMRRATGSHRIPEPLEEDRAPHMDISEFQPLAAPASTTPPDLRPGFESLASMSTSPSTQRTVWGTRAVTGSPEMVPQLGPVDDGWLKEEEFLESTDLTLQMGALSVHEPHASSSAKPSGGKKKKKQKITLMSTGGRRGI